MEVKIEVTREDIENGIRKQASCCPIALAICRALHLKSEDEIVEVEGSNMVEFNRGMSDKIGYILGPAMRHEVHRFIRDFDNEEYVHPFNFVLTLDDKDSGDYEE